MESYGVSSRSNKHDRRSLACNNRRRLAFVIGTCSAGLFQHEITAASLTRFQIQAHCQDQRWRLSSVSGRCTAACTCRRGHKERASTVWTLGNSKQTPNHYQTFPIHHSSYIFSPHITYTLNTHTASIFVESHICNADSQAAPLPA
jgi:hypothetical protein